MLKNSDQGIRSSGQSLVTKLAEQGDCDFNTGQCIFHSFLTAAFHNDIKAVIPQIVEMLENYYGRFSGENLLSTLAKQGDFDFTIDHSTSLIPHSCLPQGYQACNPTMYRDAEELGSSCSIPWGEIVVHSRATG